MKTHYYPPASLTQKYQEQQRCTNVAPIHSGRLSDSGLVLLLLLGERGIKEQLGTSGQHNKEQVRAKDHCEEGAQQHKLLQEEASNT